MFDQSGYRAGPSGGTRKYGGAAAQSPRVPQRASDSELVEGQGESKVFVLGGNGNTLALTNSFRPGTHGDTITARLIPIARTPLGVAVGQSRQEAAIPLARLFDWIDRTFPPEDELAFVAPVRDIDLLARIGWNAPFPELLDPEHVLNIDDLPEDVADGLARPATELVQCASCHRLCPQNEFVWREKQLCAWDYHAQVFGKRGPWREGRYDEPHFETLPFSAYVVPELLADAGSEPILIIGGVAEETARTIVNALLDADPARAHVVVRTEHGLTVLREA